MKTAQEYVRALCDNADDHCLRGTKDFEQFKADSNRLWRDAEKSGLADEVRAIIWRRNNIPTSVIF